MRACFQSFSLHLFTPDAFADTITLAQISQATYDLVCDDGAFQWDERGFVDVKGKGEMKTYFLLKAGESERAAD